MSSRDYARGDRTPFVKLVDRANRALQADMVRAAHRQGYPKVRYAHNAVFSTLGKSGARASDMAERSGITRQSMGEIIRDMVSLGILEMVPDPEDRRAKLVTFTDAGLANAKAGYAYILELEQRLIDEFGEAEYETVRDVLQRLVLLLDETAED